VVDTHNGKYFTQGVILAVDKEVANGTNHLVYGDGITLLDEN